MAILPLDLLLITTREHHPATITLLWHRHSHTPCHDLRHLTLEDHPDPLEEATLRTPEELRDPIEARTPRTLEELKNPIEARTHKTLA